MSNQRINTKPHRIRFKHLFTTENYLQLHPDDDSQALVNWSDRQLFYRLMHPDSSGSVLQAAYMRLDKQFREIENRPGHSNQLSGQLDILEDELLRLQNTARIETLVETNSLRGAIRQYAPMALLEGCWLQSVSNASLAHTDTAACLFQIYANILGYTPNSNKPLSLYRKVLDDFNLILPETHTHLFAFHPGFVDAAFKAPLTGLCLAQLPVTFLPEILGYTLAYTFSLSKSLRIIELMTQSSANLPDSLKHYLYNPQHASTGDLTLQATHAFIQQQPAEQQSQFWHRLSLGIALYADVESDLVDALQQQSADIQRVWGDVIHHEQQLSIQQSGSRNITLCGHQINDWFVNEPLVAVNFVKEILNADNPQYYNAEMRRFFSDSSVFEERSLQSSELRLFNQLAEQLTALDSTSQITPPEQTAAKNLPKKTHQRALNKYNSRQLYFELLNLESNPQCLNAAYQFVSRYIAKSRSVMRRIQPAYQRLIEFSHAGFDQQIQAIYQAEESQQKQFVAPPKLSREAYLWGIEQFAPVLLVDGSWLQNIAKAGNHQHAISRYLLRIYADEIGDGRSDWNHANVYRQLLESTGIQLPEFTTEQFSQHPGFINSAFDLPVFFLAVSQFPSSFEAETIGLNLAIELSGLGSTYSRLVDDLNYWNIDPAIVSLHLSIDNLATGHAALAHDAVVVYLDQILNISGYAEMQRHWQRIWSGYLALQIVPAGFKRALIWNYFKRFVVMQNINKLISLN
ncbi:MAG: iron-containing redox enzyme family protein [Methylococcales bacterium]